MTTIEMIAQGGTLGLVGALLVAVRFQTNRLIESQRQQIEELRGAVCQSTAAMLAVKEALDECRKRQAGETRHFRSPKP